MSYCSGVKVEQGSEEDLLVGPHAGESCLWRSSASWTCLSCKCSDGDVRGCLGLRLVLRNVVKRLNDKSDSSDQLGEREYQSDSVLELIVADEMFVLLRRLAESGRNQKWTRMKARQKFTTRRLLQPIDGQMYTILLRFRHTMQKLIAIL